MLLPCSMLRTILLSLLLCGQNGINADDFFSSEEDESSIEDSFVRRGGFVFLMPREVFSGQNVNACVTLHNVKRLPTEVAVHLKILGETHTTIQTVETDYSCFELIIPAVHSKTAPFYITVTVTIEGMNLRNMEQDPVLFYPKQDTLFLQTDKQEYRPGDTIRIRLLLLNLYLQPDYTDKIKTVTIQNPAGVLEALWVDQPVQLGLVHLEYKTSERALEGDWIIEAGRSRKIIVVTKQATPRFEVYVNNTDYIDQFANAYYYRVCGMYFFGKPVEGSASIKLKVERPIIQIQKSKKTENGCADFIVSASEFNILHHYSFYAILEASIEESGTGSNVTVTKEMRMERNSYNLRIDFPRYYRPGFPIPGELEMVDIRTQYDNEIMTVCYNMITERGLRFSETELCSDFTADKANKVYFTIPPLSSDIRSIYVSVKSGGKILIFNKAVTTNSSSDEIITPESLANMVNINHKYTKFGVHIKSFAIQFELDLNVLFDYELLVYTVLSSGEVVADSKIVRIGPCFRNKVALAWSKDSYRPGETIKALINTVPGSLCSLIAVNAKNDSAFEDLNVEDAFAKRRSELARQLHSFRGKCLTRVTNKKIVEGDSEGRDAYGIFQDFAGALVTNLKVVTKICHHYSKRPHRSNRAVPIKEESPSGTNNERNVWLDTWLWDLVQTDDKGTAELTKQLPHDITKWAINAVCISPEEELGVSEIHNLKVLKPFFLDVIAPHSIKRGKSSVLYVKIFNYHSDPVSVKLQIHANNNINVSSEDIAAFIIQSSDVADYSFEVNAVTIGTAKLTVAAEAVDKDRDVVFKEILIEPEGYSLEEVRNELLCSHGVLPKSVTWDIQLPESAVVNVNRSGIVLDSSRLGFKLEEIGEMLLREADDLNVILLQNWYILRYFDSTPGENSSQFTNYIEQAYSQILKFRNEDGSFQKFRSRKKETSLSLNVFAIRNLARSKQFINVDEDIITVAIKWIFDQQLENGCFDDKTRDIANFSSLLNTTESISQRNYVATLTSYIFAYLSEAGIEIPSSMIGSFRQCVFGYIHDTEDQYVRAITTYALLISGSVDKATSLLLEDIIKQFPINSEVDEIPTSREIEIVAYILLSLHYQNDAAHLTYSREAVKLLRRYFVERRMFNLTDVVAADALSKYGIVAGFENDVKIHVSIGKQHEEIVIGKKDHLKMNRVDLKEFGNALSINVSGKGYVYAKAVIEYNTPNLIQGPLFLLNVSAEIDPNGGYCARKIIPCVALGGSYVYSYKTVIEVNLPKGFAVVTKTVHGLYKKSKKFDGFVVKGSSRLYMYFKGMLQEELCTPFTIVHDNVNETYSGLINVYDFYNHNYNASKEYHVATCNNPASS